MASARAARATSTSIVTGVTRLTRVRKTRSGEVSVQCADVAWVSELWVLHKKHRRCDLSVRHIDPSACAERANLGTSVQ